LSTPLVLHAPRRGVPFKLYIIAEEKIIRVVLTQEDKGKEYVIAYLGRRLFDHETRYAHIEKLCLSLYYACAKMRHYLLSSTCVVACQADVIKHVLYRPILHGRIGKWAYALIEYDLTFEPLKTLRGQVLADFIVEHGIDLDDEVNYLTFTPWKLCFDGLVCKDGQGVGIILVSPNGAKIRISSQLDFYCTNNQTVDTEFSSCAEDTRSKPEGSARWSYRSA